MVCSSRHPTRWALLRKPGSVRIAAHDAGASHALFHRHGRLPDPRRPALSGLVSPAEVVDAALREFVDRRRQPVKGLAGGLMPDRPQDPHSARGLCRGMNPMFGRDEADR